jgi:hypothetical protein
MNATQNGEQVHICPMHKDVRQSGPRTCPHCGTALLPEDTRFALARHMMSNPLHLVVMGAIMVVLMISAMMTVR